MPYRIIRSWYTGHWWMGCCIWYSEEGPGRAGALPSPLLTVPNVTAHPSTASVPITVLLYDGPLLCSFNMAIKGLGRHLLLYEGMHLSILCCLVHSAWNIAIIVCILCTRLWCDCCWMAFVASLFISISRLLYSLSLILPCVMYT